MLSMVDPKADAIWNSVATIVTLEGTEEKRPRTEEDWVALRHDAITLVEATNLLLIGGRQVAKPGVKSENPGIELEPEEIQARIAQDPETWKKMVHGLHDASMVMLDAVDARNVDMLFDNGGNLDAACESCHRQYWYPDPEHHAPPPSEAEKALGESADAGTDPAAPRHRDDRGTRQARGQAPRQRRDPHGDGSQVRGRHPRQAGGAGRVRAARPTVAWPTCSCSSRGSSPRPRCPPIR